MFLTAGKKYFVISFQNFISFLHYSTKSVMIPSRISVLRPFQNGVVQEISTYRYIMSCSDLDSYLTSFYVEARRKDGQPYEKSALLSIRYALERYLNSPPCNRSVSLYGEQFKTSTKMLVSVVKELRSDGNENVEHKLPMSDGDCHKLQFSSSIFSDDDLLALLRGVWFFCNDPLVSPWPRKLI